MASLWLHGYLLDEYEWERACRGAKAATQRTKWWYGDQEDELGKYAWYYPNSGRRTHPVDSRSARGADPDDKLPNDLGLYHMHGNVWEWTSSWYHDDPREGRETRLTRKPLPLSASPRSMPERFAQLQ